jgi:hypothetical protein
MKSQGTRNKGSCLGPFDLMALQDSAINRIWLYCTRILASGTQTEVMSCTGSAGGYRTGGQSEKLLVRVAGPRWWLCTVCSGVQKDIDCFLAFWCRKSNKIAWSKHPPPAWKLLILDLNLIPASGVFSSRRKTELYQETRKQIRKSPFCKKKSSWYMHISA